MNQLNVIKAAVREVSEGRNTEADNKNVIVGNIIDQQDPNAAWSIKRTNLLSFAHSKDCREQVLGIVPFVPIVFNATDSSNKHMVDLIESAVANLKRLRRDAVIAKYEGLSPADICKAFNQLHIGVTIRYPNFTFTNNNNVPPLAFRTNYTLAWPDGTPADQDPPGFVPHDVSTWLTLTDPCLDVAIDRFGYRMELLNVRGPILRHANSVATMATARFAGISLATPRADLISIAQELGVYDKSLELTTRDESNHAKNLEKDNIRRANCRLVFQIVTFRALLFVKKCIKRKTTYISLLLSAN